MEELKARGFLDCVLVNSVPSSLVYSASHPSCPMCTPKVAIKLRTLSSPSALQAAYKEVEILQRLSHPNITRFCECLQYPEGSGRFGLVTEWGEKHLLQDMTDRAKKMVEYGAGEILLTSMDRDGTRVGFDLEVTRAISEAVTVPVIASGGVGNLQHLADGIIDGKADAVLAASIFHFAEYTIREAKEHMASRGIEVRL